MLSLIFNGSLVDQQPPPPPVPVSVLAHGIAAINQADGAVSSPVLSDTCPGVVEEGHALSFGRRSRRTEIH